MFINILLFVIIIIGDGMEKTKVIATIGPSSESKDVLRKMIQNGLDVLRINMSYSNHEDCKQIIKKVNELNEELGTFVSIMLDTNGNNINIDKLSEGKAKLKTGDKIRIYKNKIMGDSTKFSTSFPNFVSETRIGSILILNDGLSGDFKGESDVAEIFENAMNYNILAFHSFFKKAKN